MSNPVVELLGKDFEFIRIDKIKSKNPLLFIENGKLDKCKIAVQKLGITSIYCNTEDINYLSDPIFSETSVLYAHITSVDYSPIKHLKKLKQLTLTSAAYVFDSTKVPELDLGGLDKLISIECAIPNPICNLQQLTKLTKVSITSDEGTSLGSFKNAHNIKELKLIGFSGENLSGIENLSKLTKLQISGKHQLNNIKAIASLQNLKTLELKGGELSNLSGIEGLKNLEKLDLNNFKKIEDSSVLTGLTSLKDLTINNIDSIDTMRFMLGLDNLKKVFVLPWTIHPKDGSFLGLTQKLVQMNALKQVIEWDDVYTHLDEAGQKIFKEHFKGSALDYIKRTFSFYQKSYNNTAPFTKNNCKRLDSIIYELIDALEKYKKMTAEDKKSSFISCLVAIDELDFELKGFFETGEREHLFQVLQDIGNVVEVNPENFKPLPMPVDPKGQVLEDYFGAEA